MYTQADFEVIRDMVVNDIPGAVRLILFGSYARGTAREDSDIDMVILTENPVERREKLKLLTSLRWEIARKGYNADFLVKNEEDFLREKNLPTLSRVISSEGKVLWKRG